MIKRSSALFNQTFLTIWFASLVSGVAVAAHETAATWTMNLMSPSALFISLMASFSSLPLFLFTLPAGVIADAFGENRVLRFANLWLATCAGSLALLGWAGKLNPPLLLVGVFLLGVGFAISAPAWASLVPKLVTKEELASATTLSGVQLNVSGILGPCLAGILLTKFGAPFLFGLNAAGFLLVFASIPAPRGEGRYLGQTLKNFTRSILDSCRYAWQSRNVRDVLVQNAIFSSFVVVIPALAPVLLLKELRLDASSLGLVFASMGAGSVLSAFFIIPWLRSRFSTQRLMVLSQVCLVAIYVLMATVHHCLYCLVAMALAGASWTLAGSQLWVTLQSALPDAVRGRISALMMVVGQGAMTLGGAVWGLSATLAGTRPTLFTAAFLFLVAVVVRRLLSTASTLGSRNVGPAAILPQVSV